MTVVNKSVYRNVFLFLIVVMICLIFFLPSSYFSKKLGVLNIRDEANEKINVWIIFNKALGKGSLVTSFKTSIESICSHSTVHISFNIISDNSSQTIANNILSSEDIRNRCSFNVNFFNKDDIVLKIQDIYDSLNPHFSIVPGGYYADPLFYFSLGLYKVAPQDQDKIIILDCDLVFLDNILHLFEEFNKFSKTNLIGIAHELSPVYHYSLNKSDFSGFNSGVVLLDLHKIRQSSLYEKLLRNETVNYLTEKYSFHGTLGDQDYYTLLYLEYAEIFYVLNCGWNRQLCKWWKKSENDEIFEKYFKCNFTTRIYHKNCHTSLSDQ